MRHVLFLVVLGAREPLILTLFVTASHLCWSCHDHLVFAFRMPRFTRFEKRYVLVNFERVFLRGIVSLMRSFARIQFLQPRQLLSVVPLGGAV